MFKAYDKDMYIERLGVHIWHIIKISNKHRDLAVEIYPNQI